ncbi:MAG: ribonuclease HII [Acidobacteriota bacterium]
MTITLGRVFAEAYRLRLMRGLEERLADGGFLRVAGVDEAGRGALAGPVVAAAVLVEPGVLVPGVDDSKHVAPAARERLAAAVRRAHPVHAVVAVDADAIDRLDILQATRRAMRLAVARLAPAPDLTLIDAVRLDLSMPSLPVVRGDQVSYAVACASLLAKTERDARMVELDRRYPAYGFAAHKGYGAQAHRQALAAVGPCAVHRLTFRSVLPRRAEASARRRRPKVASAPAGRARAS